MDFKAHHPRTTQLLQRPRSPPRTGHSPPATPPLPIADERRTVDRRLGPVRDLELRESGEKGRGVRQGASVQGKGIAHERGTVRPELGGAVTQMLAQPVMRIPAGAEGIHEGARVAQEDAEREGLIVGKVLGDVLRDMANT